MMSPKGRFWRNRRTLNAQDIADLRRAADGQRREPGPCAESVRLFREAIQERHGGELVTLVLD
jgi:hypothetical protein